MTTLVDRVLPPKPTDAEIAEGKPKRDAFRNEVQTLQTQLDQSAQGLKELQLQGLEKELQTTVKKANAWLDANIEVTKRQVESEQIRFQEEIQKQLTNIQKEIPSSAKKLSLDKQNTIASSITIPQVKKTIQTTIEELRKQAKKDAEKSSSDLQNRGITDDIQDASKEFAKYGGIIIMILLALRVGAFAANATLHQPVGVRVINFLFTALFFPFFIFYYGIFEIRHLIWPNDCEALRIESMLPIYGYPADKNITFWDRILGYPLTDSLVEEINAKKAAFEQRRLDVLKISQLASLSSS